MKIEQGKYDTARVQFEKAIHLNPANPLPVLWNAYAKYLQITFDSSPGDTIHNKEGLAGIIRELERRNVLLSSPLKEKDEKYKAYILYFLGCFYFKTQDFFMAKEMLKDCIRFNSSIRSSAHYLLVSIWEHKIRPTWWRWWFLPTYWWLKMLKIIGFFLLLILIFGLLVLHPFIPTWLKKRFKKRFSTLRWTLYTILIVLLVIFLFSPSIERLGTKDVEVEFISTSFEPVLSPSMIGTILELEKLEQPRGMAAIEEFKLRGKGRL